MIRARLVIATSLLLGAVGSAHADDDKADRDAQARFDEGLQRVKRGDSEGARLAFTQAYSVLKTPEVAFNLALSELKTNHSLEALEHFRFYSKDPKLTDVERARAERYIHDASTKVGHVSLRISPGAAVKLDDRLVDPQSTMDVEPGKHRIVVSYEDVPKAADVDVGAGATASVDLTREAQAPVAPIVVHDVVEAKRQAVAFPPPPQTLVLGGLALVALGVGIGFSVDSSHQSSLIDSSAPGVCANPQAADCQARQSALDAHGRDVTVSTAMYISSAVAVAGAVITWILWPSTRPVSGSAQSGQTTLSLKF